MANAMNSLTYGGTTYVNTLPYGVCSTAAGTAAKTVTIDAFSLETGVKIAVKFSNANSASSPTLNVNSTGAKSIVSYGTTSAGTYKWNAGAVVEMTYDGTSWVMEAGTLATTTYYGLTKLSSSTSSTSTSLAATPSAVKTAYDLAAAAATTALYSATIGTSWTGSSAPYTQSITVSGILATDTPIVDVNLSSITYANKDAVLEAYAKVYRITTAANSITVYADEATKTSIPIQLKVVR